MSDVIFDFTGKVALVTGAASGIGRAVARKFADSGASVAVSDISEEPGTETARLIQEAGGKAFFQKCDIMQENEIELLVKKTIETFGALTFACNNAGVEGNTGNTVDCTTENWNHVLDTNLRGLWLCLKHEIPELLKNGGGSIVNISSIAGLIGFGGLPAYVSSKHGVVGLTKTTALEYAQQNLRVNAICPGPIMTPMLQRLINGTPGFQEQILAGVPEHRIGMPDDIAFAVLFLCSAHAAYITGQSLAIDGGWVAQ